MSGQRRELPSQSPRTVRRLTFRAWCAGHAMRGGVHGHSLEKTTLYLQSPILAVAASTTLPSGPCQTPPLLVRGHSPSLKTRADLGAGGGVVAAAAGADATAGWGTEGVVVGTVAGADAGGVVAGVVTTDEAATCAGAGDFLIAADEGAAVDIVTGNADAFDGATAPTETTKNGRKARRLRKRGLVMAMSFLTIYGCLASNASSRAVRVLICAASLSFMARKLSLSAFNFASASWSLPNRACSSFMASIIGAMSVS